MKKTSTYLLIILLGCLGSLKAQIFTPVRKMLVEDQTICATGFGIYCPRGMIYIDSLMKGAMGSQVEIISVHSSYAGPPDDAMTDSVYANGCQNSPHLNMRGWPSMSIDRKVNSWTDSLFYNCNQHLGDFGVAELTVTPVYNATSRTLDVTATAHFAVDATQCRLALALTEDSVHGTTINYAQRNVYAGGTSGPMAGVGIDFTVQPDPVPAALMYYRNVARAILPSFGGAAGSLPTTLTAGNTYSYTFPSYTVPAGYNASKMRAIVLLIKISNGQVMNANGINLADSVAAVHQIANGGPDFSVFPNPFSDETALRITLSKAGHVSMLLSDITGRTISVRDMTLSPGVHSLTLSGKEMGAGIYFVTLKTDYGSLTKKVIVSK